MTVSSQLDRKTFTGDAITVAFGTSPLVFFDETDLLVYVITTATGASELQSLTTDYTVSGGDGSTGTVTMLSAPTALQTLLIKRVVPYTQTTDFVNNDASDAEVLEDVQDRAVMGLQQLAADKAYAIRLSDAETPTAALTTLPFDRASTYLAFNEDKELEAALGSDGTSGVLALALAASTGSSLVGHVGSGSGLSATTVSAQLQKAEFFESIAALRLWSGSITNKSLAFVRGYYAAGDGGGGLYYWDSASTDTENGGTVIVPTGQGSTGRFLRQYDADQYSFKVFGAKGDAVTVDATAMQTTLNSAAVLGTNVTAKAPRGVYNLGTTTLSIPEKVTIAGEGVKTSFINYVGTGTGISISGVSEGGLRDLRIGLGSSATIVAVKIATSVGNSVLRFRMQNVEIASSLTAGQIGIQCVATGADIITECWFTNIHINGLDKPIIRSGIEGNFWIGIDISEFGASNNAIAIDSACNADFLQARIAGLTGSGTNKVGYKQTAQNNIDDVVVDIGGSHTALNITGTQNVIRVARSAGGTPLGTVAAGNILMDTAGTALFRAAVITADAGTDGFGLRVTNTTDASDQFRVKTQAAGSGPTMQAANNAGDAYAHLNVEAASLRLNHKIYPGTDAAAAQTAAGLYAGSGAPNNANGSDGDYYFRSDGTAAGSTCIYHRQGGAWVALVTS